MQKAVYYINYDSKTMNVEVMKKSISVYCFKVDDQEEQNVEKTKTKGKTKKEKPKQKKLNEKYKGYEILLDYEDDPNFVDPAGDYYRFYFLSSDEINNICESFKNIMK